MAPPTGPRSSGTNKPAPRTSRGGGITKRRGPTARTDRDGDVSMDAPAGSAKGGASNGPAGGRPSRGGRGAVNSRGGGSARTSSRIAQNLRNYTGERGVGLASKAQFNRVTLKIHGLNSSKAASNADGGLRSLLEFLERKAGKEKQVMIGKSILDGDFAWISVSKEDAPAILHLNGFTYAGAPLMITETTERMPTNEDRISRAAAETKAKLTEVLAKRYNPEQKLFDFSALGADDILSSMGTFNSQNLAEKAFKALVHLASVQYKNPDEKREAIQAVSLAQNDINDVEQVFQLAQSLPELRRLDLSNNKLDTLSKLQKWSHRFRYLEELHLTGNPIVNQPNLVTELMNWFPSLHNLNGQQIRTPEQVLESLKALSPTPLPQYPSSLRDGEANVAGSFLQAFFPMYDSDRARLAAEFYDSDSWFSITVAANSSRNLPWKTYLRYSRNVQKLGPKNPGSVQRLFTGGSLITDMWKLLPATRHPGIDQPDQWLIDCHTFPHLADPSGHGFATGLFINVNGRFEEADPTNNLFGMRTFSRTFVLGPSKPGNPIPYRVISDQLTLHDWTPKDPPVEQAAVAGPVITPVVTPAAPPVLNSAAVPVVNPVPVVATVQLDPATKNQLIQEVSNRTGMTAQYSELCLSGAANWNFELALKSFEEVRPTLPPSAFLVPT